MFCLTTAGVSLSVPVVSLALHTGTGDVCPAGAECPSTSGYFSFCQPGTYSPATGYAACLPCTQGTHSFTNLDDTCYIILLLHTNTVQFIYFDIWKKIC